MSKLILSLAFSVVASSLAMPLFAEDAAPSAAPMPAGMSMGGAVDAKEAAIRAQREAEAEAMRPRPAVDSGALERAAQPTLMAIRSIGGKATATFRLGDGAQASILAPGKINEVWTLSAVNGLTADITKAGSKKPLTVRIRSIEQSTGGVNFSSEKYTPTSSSIPAPFPEGMMPAGAQGVQK